MEIAFVLTILVCAISSYYIGYKKAAKVHTQVAAEMVMEEMNKTRFYSVILDEYVSVYGKEVGKKLLEEVYNDK